MFEELNAHLSRAMRGWPIVRTYLLRDDGYGVLDHAGIELEEIAFLNMVKTPGLDRSHDVKRDWETATHAQLALLAPRRTVILGSKDIRVAPALRVHLR